LAVRVCRYLWHDFSRRAIHTAGDRPQMIADPLSAVQFDCVKSYPAHQ
jgi:hypothetical protein